MLLRGQFPILAQFPSQVRARFRVLWGFALGCGLGIPSSFQVAFRVKPTHWVSLAHDFSLPLPVVVINGLYGNDRLVMMHHLVFDVTGWAFVGLPEEGMVTPLYVGHCEGDTETRPLVHEDAPRLGQANRCDTPTQW